MILYQYVVCEPDTGRVYVKGNGELRSVDPQNFSPTAEVVTYVGGRSDNLHVSNGEVLDCVEMPLIATNTPLLANGTDEAVISGIPEGVQVEWPDGQTDIVTGGEIRFSVDLAGTYTFRFTAVPYLDQEVTIEAIAAT